MGYIIVGLVCLIGGGVGVFLFLKNNPEYLNLQKIGKYKLEELETKIKEELKKRI